jgi:hypothetical protein
MKSATVRTCTRSLWSLVDEVAPPTFILKLHQKVRALLLPSSVTSYTYQMGSARLRNLFSVGCHNYSFRSFIAMSGIYLRCALWCRKAQHFASNHASLLSKSARVSFPGRSILSHCSSLFHFLFLFHSRTRTISLALALSLSLSLSHTHTHTHTHSLSRFRSLSRFPQSLFPLSVFHALLSVELQSERCDIRHFHLCVSIRCAFSLLSSLSP